MVAVNPQEAAQKPNGMALQKRQFVEDYVEQPLPFMRPLVNRLIRPIASILNMRVKLFISLSLGELLTFLILIAVNVGYVVVAITGGSLTVQKGQPIDDHRFPAKAIGSLCQVNLAILMLPVSRVSIFQWLLGISFERALILHKWAGLTYCASTGIHFALYVYGWNIAGELSQQIFTTSYFCGTIALGSGVIIILFSLWFVRRYAWEVFRAVHVLSAVAVICSIIHEVSTFLYVLPGLIFYAYDLFGRVRSYKTSLQCNAVVTGSITKIEFAKPFHYKAGQYVFVNIPSVSKLQWHPLSIASSPQNNTMIVCTKAIGGWSRDVVKTAQAQQISEILVNGPYGLIEDYFFANPSVVLVAGGIGVTPVMSILTHLWHTCLPNQEIYFIWVVKDKDDFSLFEEQLLTIASKPNFFLRVYFTKTRVDETTVPINIQNGRPDIQTYFRSKIVATSDRKASVFTCGPKALCDSVWAAVSRNFHIEFHQEIFEL